MTAEIITAVLLDLRSAIKRRPVKQQHALAPFRVALMAGKTVYGALMLPRLSAGDAARFGNRDGHMPPNLNGQDHGRSEKQSARHGVSHGRYDHTEFLLHRVASPHHARNESGKIQAELRHHQAQQEDAGRRTASISAI